MIFGWKLPVFKLIFTKCTSVRELCANYLIDILEDLVIKCRLFQFLITSGIGMESTIRTGDQNGRNSVAKEMKISDWKTPFEAIVRQLHANFWHFKANVFVFSFYVVAHVSRVPSEQEVKMDGSTPEKNSMFDWK